MLLVQSMMLNGVEMIIKTTEQEEIELDALKQGQGEPVGQVWIFGGLALPFFPFAALIYLFLLVAALFVPALWFGL
jgi:hypothetical protein